MENRNGWVIWNTGGNCFVSFKVLAIERVGQRVVGVNEIGVLVYKATTIENFNKDKGLHPGINFSFSPDNTEESMEHLKRLFTLSDVEDIVREVNRHVILCQWYENINEQGSPCSVKPMLTRNGKNVLASANPTGVTVYEGKDIGTSKGLIGEERFHEIPLIGDKQNPGVQALNEIFFPESVEGLVSEHRFYVKENIPMELQGALEVFARSARHLQAVWEKFDDTDLICKRYPFREDFREIVSSISEWASNHINLRKY